MISLLTKIAHLIRKHPFPFEIMLDYISLYMHLCKGGNHFTRVYLFHLPNISPLHTLSHLPTPQTCILLKYQGQLALPQWQITSIYKTRLSGQYLLLRIASNTPACINSLYQHGLLKVSAPWKQQRLRLPLPN